MNRCRWLRSDGLCACRPQARLIAEGLGGGEIAEKEASALRARRRKVVIRICLVVPRGLLAPWPAWPQATSCPKYVAGRYLALDFIHYCAETPSSTGMDAGARRLA